MDIQKNIDSNEIEENLRRILYIENAADKSIEWAMNYITFSPCKRVRPLLLIEANKIFGAPDEDSHLLSAAIELIHTYSLVHDDLPCMDDDDLRRGVPTIHKIKDEAFAVLTGDALLTRAFGILSGYSKVDKLPAVLKLFADNSGYGGMIKGQVLDMEGEGKALSPDQINEINVYKTGCLLTLPLVLGALNGGADKIYLDEIEMLGRYIGIIFQLQDDILDIVGDTAALGKKTGSDEKNGKCSIPLVLGLDAARSIMENTKEKAMRIVNFLPANRDFFSNFIDFLISRTK